MVADGRKVQNAEAGEGYWDGIDVEEGPVAEVFDPADQSR